MNRYAHIDAMRAFAVLLVVFSHAGLSFVPGGSGVTIFFVISGFIITYLLLRERDKTGGFDISGFYMRRLIKIAPPLVLAIIVPTMIYMVMGGPVNFLDFLGQIFFFINWRYLDAHITVLPGSHVTWSLAIEEQFYLVFALVWLLAVKSRHYIKIVVAVASAAIIYSVLARSFLAAAGAASSRIYFGTDTRLEAIAVGTLVAVWFFTHRESESVLGSRRAGRRFKDAAGQGSGRTVPVLGRNWVIGLALVLYIFSLMVRDPFFRDTLRYSIQACSAALMILWGQVATRQRLGSQLMRVLSWQPIQVLGLASYSIYISHSVLYKLVEPHLDFLPLPVVVFTLVALGLGLGVAMWKWIEVPALAFKDRYFASANTRAEQQARAQAQGKPLGLKQGVS